MANAQQRAGDREKHLIDIADVVISVKKLLKILQGVEAFFTLDVRFVVRLPPQQRARRCLLPSPANSSLRHPPLSAAHREPPAAAFACRQYGYISVLRSEQSDPRWGKANPGSSILAGRSAIAVAEPE